MTGPRKALRYAALYAFHIVIVRPVLRLFAGLRIRRRALVPEGPCLVVANHNSHLDAAVLMSLFSLRRLPRVHPVAAADYFGTTWFRRMMAMVFMNGIPIARHPEPGRDPLAPLIDTLRAGGSLVFFPEGSRGEAGVVAPFRPGVGRLVRKVPGLLVVPVFMSGPERIWPRGAFLPLPLGIDANVGKPRTYSPHLDARDIAEEVRRDVLALAPPPPPLPGPPPPKPTKVAVCGIDVELRREVYLAIAERLGKLDRTIGVGRPILEADSDGVREAVGGVPIAQRLAWPALLAWAFRTGGVFKGSKFAEMVDRARVDEALNHGRTTRYVVSDGDALVDLLAWANAGLDSEVYDEKGLQQVLLYLAGERKIPVRQWWRFIRRSPELWLLNVFDLARPPSPHLIVLVTLDPDEAMARLRARGERLAEHENEASLARLQDAYRTVSEVVRRRRRIEVIEIDAAALSAGEIGQRVEDACRRVVPETEQPAARTP